MLFSTAVPLWCTFQAITGAVISTVQELGTSDLSGFLRYSWATNGIRSPRSHLTCPNLWGFEADEYKIWIPSNGYPGVGAGLFLFLFKSVRIRTKLVLPRQCKFVYLDGQVHVLHILFPVRNNRIIDLVSDLVENLLSYAYFSGQR